MIKDTIALSNWLEAGYNSVKRWTKEVDLFSYSLVLVPVHLGDHWCLATIDMDKKSIVYYDSMGGNNKVIDIVTKFIYFMM